MTCTEQPVVFDCAGESLVGVLAMPSAPADAPADLAVLIVTGGPQYRAGSHRQFTLLARAIAAGGHPSLRFDCRGMGDSEGAMRSFERISEDIAAAIDTLFQHARPPVRRVVLWGLCDGASAALLYLHERADPRILGLCLANPWVRSATSLARTHVKHYYWRRLMQRQFWSKFLRGGVARQALADLMANLRLAARWRRADAASTVPYQQRMAQAWRSFTGEILLVLSGNDFVAREFCEQVNAEACWNGNLEVASLTRLDLATANHTFSDVADTKQVAAATLEWLQRIATGMQSQPYHGTKVQSLSTEDA